MRPLYVTAALLTTSVLTVYGCRAMTGPSGDHRSAKELVQVALDAGSAAEKQRAAVLLASAKADAEGHLQRLYQQSGDAAVRATTIQALGDTGEQQNIELLLVALEDRSWLVRARAKAALARILNRSITFDPQGSEQLRKVQVAQVRHLWRNLNQRDLFEYVNDDMPLSYFYDLNTGALFEAAAVEGPIETESGSYNGMPAGVRAHIYACGDCSNASKRFIGWLEVHGEQLRKYGVRVDSGQTNESTGDDDPRDIVMIRRPGDRHWVPAGSPRGKQIVSDARQMCSRNEQLVYCRPGK